MQKPADGKATEESLIVAVATADWMVLRVSVAFTKTHSRSNSGLGIIGVKTTALL